MTTRKKKPEKPRKATPKRAASVAAERDAARAFELGEQMTALRQERDEAQARLLEAERQEKKHGLVFGHMESERNRAVAELGRVANVLDEWGPQHQREDGSYVSHSAAVLEALEGLRKQRDEAREQARGLERRLMGERLDFAARRAGLTRWGHQEIGPAAQQREREFYGLLRGEYVTDADRAAGATELADKAATDAVILEALRRCEAEQAPSGDGMLETIQKRARGLRYYAYDGPSLAQKDVHVLLVALAAAKRECKDVPAQPRTDEGARPCRDCRHSSRCKWLLGPSYKDAGPCDWSPSRFAAAGQDDATPPADDLLRVVEGFLWTWDEQNGDRNTAAPAIPGAVAALRRVLKLVKERPDSTLDALRARVQRMESALRDSEDGWEQIREWAKSDHVLQYDDGDVPVLEFADTHREACSEAVAFEPRPCDAGADWRTRGRALFAAVTALDDWLDEPPKTQANRTRILIEVYKALEAWLEIDPGARTVDAGATPTVANRPRVEPGICPKCHDFNVYGTETQCADCTAREAARSTAPVGSGAAPAPREHVHGCTRCGAHIPCGSEDPDACRERVEAHRQETDTGHNKGNP